MTGPHSPAVVPHKQDGWRWMLGCIVCIFLRSNLYELASSAGLLRLLLTDGGGQASAGDEVCSDSHPEVWEGRKNRPGHRKPAWWSCNWKGGIRDSYMAWPPGAKSTSATGSQIDWDKVNLDLLFVTLLNWIILISDYLQKAAQRHHLHLQMHWNRDWICMHGWHQKHFNTIKMRISSNPNHDSTEGVLKNCLKMPSYFILKLNKGPVRNPGPMWKRRHVRRSGVPVPWKRLWWERDESRCHLWPLLKSCKGGDL